MRILSTNLSELVVKLLIALSSDLICIMWKEHFLLFPRCHALALFGAPYYFLCLWEIVIHCFLTFSGFLDFRDLEHIFIAPLCYCSLQCRESHFVRAQVPNLALWLGTNPSFDVFNQSCALTVLSDSGNSLLNTNQKCRKYLDSSALFCRKLLRRSKRRKTPRSSPSNGTQRTKPASP